tara:strand:- start:676 stop:885 length:210 start_codon:yes stop_codon:yes gene_type:complete
MIKWIKDLFNAYDEAEKESLRAGIINVIHPFMGTYTWVDQKTYKAYLEKKQKEHDRKETLPTSNKELKS